MLVSDFRAGYYEPQGGYKAFVPDPINHEWVLGDAELERALAQANSKLGALDALAKLIPEIDSFIELYIAKEATTSSKIEGTRTNIEEAFLSEAEVKAGLREDWQEVQNYINAMNESIKALSALPLSSRLIRDAHRTLMSGVRGKNKQPGEFRRSQNWIGGATVQQAKFVPPPFNAVPELISDIERFIHNDSLHVAELLKIAIIHYQFETIHPFLDGNGRTGRLLITLQLLSAGYLKYPVLYLSDYIERNRSEYYDKLNSVREDNDLRSWLLYFLRGVALTSEEGVETMQATLVLKDQINEKLAKIGRLQENARIIIQRLFAQPMITINEAADILEVSFPAASRVITKLEGIELLEDITGQTRNRIFAFRPYLNLFK